MGNIQGSISTLPMCEYSYFNSKSVYLQCFGKLPSISMMSRINGLDAFETFIDKYSTMVKEILRYRYHVQAKDAKFDTTIVILNNHCVVEFDFDYCEVLYPSDAQSFVREVQLLCQAFKEKGKRKPLEINLVVQNGGLELRSMEIKKTQLDIDLFYEDEFAKTDEIIRKRLRSKKDKGIVLLHGLPGTGKTTYLRYLVGKIKKRVLFLSPNIAGNLVEPEFVQLLINHPESVLIIEDAENLIMDRKLNASSAVSNLLNISDGLLADFLNVQIICTFNSPLTLVDSALLRKGRLIAKYEFGKLSVAKAQRLSDHLGFDAVITKPMTVAEIANQQEIEQKVQVEEIGFRRNYN